MSSNTECICNTGTARVGTQGCVVSSVPLTGAIAASCWLNSQPSRYVIRAPLLMPVAYTFFGLILYVLVSFCISSLINATSSIFCCIAKSQQVPAFQVRKPNRPSLRTPSGYTITNPALFDLAVSL